MKPRISYGLGYYADADLSDESTYILSCIKDNTNFQTPVPSVIDLQAAITAYNTALEAAAGLDRQKVAEKNQARKTLLALLTQLGLYVMFMANGDEFILKSSGFPMGKTPEPGKLPNPGTVTLSNGVTSGQLVSSVKRTAYARVYSHEITDQYPGEQGNWTSTHATTAKYVYNGLTPGKQYWVRVAAIGTGGQVTYSPVSTIFVQ